MVEKSGSSNEKKSQVKIVELIEVNGKHVTKEGGKRQYHHKSKNGCDNCKRRRVKCTEEKPICSKCENQSLECVYSAPQPRRRRTKKEIIMMKKALENGEPLSMSPSKDNSFDSIHKKRELDEIKEESSSNGMVFSDSRQNTNESDVSFTNKKRKLSAAYEIGTPKNVSKRKDSKTTIVKYVVTKEDGTKVTIEDDALVSKVKSPRSRSNNSNESKSSSNPINDPKPTLSQTHSNTSLQQMFQQHLNGNNINTIPQLMSLTSSEKYANAVSATSNSANNQKANTTAGNNIDPQFGAIFQNLNNAMNSPQSNSMSITNSIGTFFSLNNAKLLSNLTKSSKTEGNQSQSKSVGQQQQQPSFVGEEEISHNNQINTNDNPATPEIFKKDIGDLSKHISLSGIKQHLNNSKSPLSNLPKLASAFTNGANAWGPLLSSLSGGGQNVISGNQLIPGLNLVDLKLFHHYMTLVSTTIVDSGICVSSSIWKSYIPDLSFQFPFLMHAILAFSATHLSRTQQGLEEIVATHRLDCLKLLKDAVLEITPENTDALVGSAIILIMDSLANAVPAQQQQNNGGKDEKGSSADSGIGDFTTSAWIFHVKGAATILTAVWPLPETSRFYNLINVDLSELGQYLMASSAAEAAVNTVLNESGQNNNNNNSNSSSNNNLGGLGDGDGGSNAESMPAPNITDLMCFDESIADLYPIEIDSPYLITLAYLDKLNKGIEKDGFILRIFSFPALLDKTFLLLLMTGDMNAMRIMRCYYKMLRSFVTEKKDKIWFLEGLTQVLPADVDEYSGGGVYMMLDFLGNGLPSMMSNVFDNSNLANGFDFSAFTSANNDNSNNKSANK
ncbi:hypothetical protein HANVADRAFT_52522 [Hanseniaspora valbyensis NRRL Y-1626]|uniref:Zn(2)-C6 fungal-type domain-containing protein n=1 Tax=Hanseniaspora valbyensis NRRL Y-1626 TaxID=766949 RepID=A0A1B7TES4_9ASCO|nr:hypothetical protein HANVADRAFT_52522 [Hanseniaspora valbyensis NRRL Y-1626]